MRLGVDLGTTWTAAAIHTASGIEAVQLADHTIAMPSVVAVEDGQIVVGEAAERRLAADPSAGAREFKRRLGDSTPYVLGGTPYGAEALMGHLLQHVVAAATAQAGEAPQTVTLTHPASWGEFKLDLLREAGRVAGLASIELISEPEAAARHYANLGRLEPGQAVAVFDFGGGTFDAAVVRLGESGPELLGKPEGLERLGGIDVDQAVLAHVDAALDGQLRELDTTDPEVRVAVSRLRVECTAAKEALSSQTETSIRVALPGLNTEIRLARGELEGVVRQRMEDMLGALRRAVASSGRQLEDLSGVLLVGGSSRMPAVAEQVAAATGLPAIIEADPKLAVAAGAAWPLTGATEAGAVAADAATASPDGAARSAGAARGTADGAGQARPSRSERLRQAVALTGAVAAAGALAVGGYFTYRQWWGDEAAAAEGEPIGDDEAAELVAGIANEMLNEIMEAEAAASLDEFDAPIPGFGGGPGPFGAAGPAGPSGPPGAGPFGPGGGGGGPVFVPRPEPVPSRPSAPHRPSRPAPEDRPPRHDRPEHHDDGPGRVTTRPSDLFSDPELERVRTELRNRLEKLELPDGTDPAAAAKLRADLDGLLDRFRAYPGQSVDDAVASLKYEFEDRVRDFAQDQKIDLLIEEQKHHDTDGKPGEEAPQGEEMPPTEDEPATEEMPAAEEVPKGEEMPPADAETPTPEGTPPLEGTTDLPTDPPAAEMPAEAPAAEAPAAEAPAAETPAPSPTGGLADVFDDAPPAAPATVDLLGSPEPITPAAPAPAADPVTLTATAPADPLDDVLGTSLVATVAEATEAPTADPIFSAAVEPPLPDDLGLPDPVATVEPEPTFTAAVEPDVPDDPISVPDDLDEPPSIDLDVDPDPIDDVIDPVGV